MDSPVRGIRFIHLAIRKEIGAIADAAAGARTAADLEALAARIGFLARVGDIHTAGEEAALFPILDARVKDAVAPYLLDHEEEHALFAALAAATARALDASDALRPAAVPPVYAAAVALRHHLHLHIRKEEELMVPLLEAHLSVPEQAEHVGKMMGAFTPSDLQTVLPWMIAALGPVDRLAYVTILRRALPPERLAAMLGWIKDGVSDEVWAPLA